jgi:hypothetical protein
VFLLSRASVRPGRFTLSELAEAERKWVHPSGRVLPVKLDDTPLSTVPPYLRAVNILHPKGDVVADVANEVATMLASLRRRGDVALAGLLVAVVLSLSWLALRTTLSLY